MRSTMLHKKHKCSFLLFLATMFSLLFGWPVGSVAAFSSPEAVIGKDVTAQNNRDWSTFLSIRTARPGPPESRFDWIKIKEISPVAADMMNNIVSAQLVGINPLPLDFAQTITTIDPFVELYDELRAYYVAINYQVKIERAGFLNGVNYLLYILGLEEGHWVIVQASVAPVHLMIEAGYGFGTLEEKMALEVPLAVQALRQIPREIRVGRTRVGAHNRIYVYRIETVDFQTYIRNVLPPEWGVVWPWPWPAEAHRAGALAVKMYGWWHIVYPQYRGQGFDIRDDTEDQVYRPGTAHPTTDAAIAAVQETGVERAADGRLLKAQYWNGHAEVIWTQLNIRSGPGLGFPELTTINRGHEVIVLSSGLTERDGHRWWRVRTGGRDWGPGATVGYATGAGLAMFRRPNRPISEFIGRMSQFGTRYWADRGKNFRQMIHYYYDGSPQAGGLGLSVRFFHYQMAQPDPTITSAHPVPATARAGETITISYNVANPGATRVVLLGASIQMSGGAILSDPTNDRPVSIPSGSSTQQRSFVIPATASPGSYNLLAGLWEDVNNNGRIDTGDRPLVSRTFTGALTVTGVTPTVPTVETRSATSITATTATLNARITSEGGAAITGRGFHWRRQGGTWTWESSVHVSGNDFSLNLTGLIPNTPYEFQARAQNSAGWNNVVNTITFTTHPAAVLPLSITTTSLPPGTVGISYSTTLTASGGVPPYTWSLVSGMLPHGLSLSSGGTISGIPTAVMATGFSVQVRDTQGHTAQQGLSMTVTGPTFVDEPIEPLFRIFPNPATDILNIEWKGIGRAEIEIVSSKGLVVLRKTIDGRSNQVDVSQLPDGIYILRLVSGNNAGRATFIRQGR